MKKYLFSIVLVLTLLGNYSCSTKTSHQNNQGDNICNKIEIAISSAKKAKSLDELIQIYDNLEAEINDFEKSAANKELTEGEKATIQNLIEEFQDAFRSNPAFIKSKTRDWAYEESEIDKLTGEREYTATLESVNRDMSFSVNSYFLSGSRETVFSLFWLDENLTSDKNFLIGIKFPGDEKWGEYEIKGTGKTFGPLRLMYTKPLLEKLYNNKSFVVLLGNTEYEFVSETLLHPFQIN